MVFGVSNLVGDYWFSRIGDWEKGRGYWSESKYYRKLGVKYFRDIYNV